MDTTSLKSPNIGERLKQPLEHRARRTTFEEDEEGFHCDHTVPSFGQHGTASRGLPGPTFSPVGKRGPEGDTHLSNAVGRFWGSPLGLASWRSPEEPTGLDHWGSEKDRQGGRAYSNRCLHLGGPYSCRQQSPNQIPASSSAHLGR